MLPQMGSDLDSAKASLEFQWLHTMKQELQRVLKDVNQINKHSIVLGLRPMDYSILETASEQMNPFTELFMISSDLDQSIEFEGIIYHRPIVN